MNKFILLVWVAIFSISLVNCTSKAESNNKSTSAKPLPVFTLQAIDTMLHTDYVANVQAIQNIEIRARVHGFLDEIFVDEGKSVKKGQILFQLNSAEYKADVAKAQANLLITKAEQKSSELEVGRLQLLVDKKVVGSIELELAKAKLKAAEAKVKEAISVLNNAQIKLSFATIKAPYDGVIDRLPMKKGSLITEGTLLTTLSDAHKVFAYFNVSELEYLNYKKRLDANTSTHNNEVELVLADGTLHTEKGIIQTVEAEVNPQTGSLAFRALFNNKNLLLKHGSSGIVRLFNDLKNAVLVPQKSVFEIQDKNYVFVVDNQSKIAMKNFVPANRIDQYYIVKSGLQAGDKIVYEGIQNIKEGDSILPQPIKK
jgi:membrane fusion protein (multidrug efflux system)